MDSVGNTSQDSIYRLLKNYATSSPRVHKLTALAKKSWPFANFIQLLLEKTEKLLVFFGEAR